VMTGRRLVAHGRGRIRFRRFTGNFFLQDPSVSKGRVGPPGRAVRGPRPSDYFSGVSGGTCVARRTEAISGSPAPLPTTAIWNYRMPPGQLAAVLEDLLLTPPSRRQSQKSQMPPTQPPAYSCRPRRSPAPPGVGILLGADGQDLAGFRAVAVDRNALAPETVGLQ